jgi:hypothetical protein
LLSICQRGSISAGTDQEEVFNNQSVYQGLMGGDPSIRWQAMPEPLGYGEWAVAKECEMLAEQGLGAELLFYQDVSGRWGGQLCGK